MRSSILFAAAVAALCPAGVAQTLMFRINGSAADDYLAESVEIVGDCNRDGYDDFIVGAKFNDGNGSNAGLARVFSGRDASVLFTALGSNAGDWLGAAVAG